ncbi:MAG: hypothetical protein ACI8ZN_002787 [Bacteroidia bacterium]|jgi:uncharacterized protein YyaL (SSP411 family)
MNKHLHSNALANETSPYLLQHAHNPVNWLPWNEETLQQAKNSNKPIIISIGYSACHWCHVMERESFENEGVAAIMNAGFTCIKVDREERPDVDNVYMNAVQLITGRGGWPLNCFALPDGRPFHGGTYFRKEDWLRVLEAIQIEFVQNPEKLEDYAKRLMLGMEDSQRLPTSNGALHTQNESLTEVDESITHWAKSFDYEHGGMNKAPKFPMPSNLDLLLRYASNTQNHALQSFVNLSLIKMARGGIYDQIAGGFARYSVDAIWKVPHFEKMLYDNGQLLETYSKAFLATNTVEYQQVVMQTGQFLLDEFMSESGLMYSAYDADSEGVEGKFYVWSVRELNHVLGDDYAFVSDYYNVNELGEWEANYILLRNKSDAELAIKYDITQIELEDRIRKINDLLRTHRHKRIHPGLDDKCLTAWNALALSGFVFAHKATGMASFNDAAHTLASTIFAELQSDENTLKRNFKNGRSSIAGVIEDYALVIKAYIDFYQLNFDEVWATRARDLADYTLEFFYNHETGMFNFTSHSQNDLVLKTTDYFDNVLPSGNSVMCRNLIWISRYFDDDSYAHIADNQLSKITSSVKSYPSGFSNWMQAILDFHGENIEIIGMGSSAKTEMKKLHEHFLPNALLAVKEEEGTGIFKDRYQEGKTLFYVCKNKTCFAPVETIKEVLDLI